MKKRYPKNLRKRHEEKKVNRAIESLDGLTQSGYKIRNDYFSIQWPINQWPADQSGIDELAKSLIKRLSSGF